MTDSTSSVLTMRSILVAWSPEPRQACVAVTTLALWNCRATSAIPHLVHPVYLLPRRFPWSLQPIPMLSLVFATNSARNLLTASSFSLGVATNSS